MTPEFDEEVVFEVGSGATRGGLGTHLSAPRRGVAARPAGAAPGDRRAAEHGRGPRRGAPPREARGPRQAAAAAGPGRAEAGGRRGAGAAGRGRRCAGGAPFCGARWGRDKRVRALRAANEPRLEISLTRGRGARTRAHPRPTAATAPSF